LKLGLLAGLAAGAVLVLGSVTSADGGEPARGAVVWASAGCGACHAFAKAGSSGARGGSAPNLDRWLLPDARRLRLPVELLVLRRTYWGGRGMPAYGTSLTLQELEDIVSFVAGKPFTVPSGGTTPLAPQPVPPPLVTVGAAVVARWTKTAHLPARGALLFAKTGCLSCHTYRGSGVRRRGAKDLTRIGRAGRTAAFFATYLAAPYRRGNDLMPAYADLGAGELASLGAFLARSRGEGP
jgi:mono/diheme cytochrome c family protein